MKYLVRSNGFIILLMIIFILTDFATIVKSGGGLGVAPPYITIDAVRGGVYQKSIIIYNQNDYNITVLLNSTGETKSWVSFYEPDNLSKSIEQTSVKGMSRKNIVAKIVVPKNASNKIYEGALVVSSMPSGTNLSGNYTSVSLNLPIMLYINVTGEQILNLSVLSIDVDDVEVGFPLEIRFHLKNTGNVVIIPYVRLILTKDNVYITSIDSISDPIQPENIHTHILSINTTGFPAGDYIAHVNITLDNETMYRGNVSFSLLPEGTFTRSGEFIDLKLEGKIEEGNMIKIIATFRNTGEIETPAKLIGEVYRNGELIEVLESDEIIVPKYMEEELSIYYKIEENGSYLIKSYVLYGGKKTETKELRFTVGETRWLPNNPILYILGTISMIIAVPIIYTSWKKGYLKISKNKNRK